MLPGARQRRMMTNRAAGPLTNITGQNTMGQVTSAIAMLSYMVREVTTF